MDPLTHTISGVVLSNLLGPDHSPLAYTATFVVAANLPDIDFLTRPMKMLGTPKYYHKITHSIPGVFLLSFLASWLTYLVHPFLGRMNLFGLYLLGCSVHLLLDVLVTSGNVPLFWPFRERQFSMDALAGLNARTTSKNCGKPRYLRCTLCQFRGALFNPIFLFFLLGIVTAPIWPSHRRILSLLALLCAAVYCVVIHLWKKRVKRHIAERFPDVDPSSLHLYPSDVVPLRWLALEEKEGIYRLFFVQGVHPRIQRHESLPRPETVCQPMVMLSKEHPLYKIYRPRFAHPYVELGEQNGNVQVAWKDLRYPQSRSVSLYALKLEYDANLEIVAQEFRERWNEE